jgi:hypothetical protein
MSKQIVCPECGSADFKCQQCSWNEQDFRVLADGTLDWKILDNYAYEIEKPVGVVCAECDHDCSELFEHQIEMFEECFTLRKSRTNEQKRN